MTGISEFMTGDHRRCDGIFAEAETAVDGGNWELAGEKTNAFIEATEHHFSMEENVLFPAFEARTGMTQGPTQVMRGEHAQMRELFVRMRAALESKDSDDFLGTTETLLVMMQQHNMKEEGILYPMTDQHLGGESDSLLEQMQATA